MTFSLRRHSTCIDYFPDWPGWNATLYGRCYGTSVARLRDRGCELHLKASELSQFRETRLLLDSNIRLSAPFTRLTLDMFRWQDVYFTITTTPRHQFSRPTTTQAASAETYFQSQFQPQA
ncbi:hypothetical protein N7G274_007615 [Stereocaulon virgatum]|uniref:Uncharacterized protein n=1 Tax=Stereocaulon virgatum TaxID=373712 RepID=A0ABR4A4A1_9LECA